LAISLTVTIQFEAPTTPSKTSVWPQLF